MQSTSLYKFLIWLILALCLYNSFEKREITHLKSHTDTYLQTWIDTITQYKKVRQTLLKHDTIFIDTFSLDSNGLKGAIRLHRYIDSIESQ